MKQWSRIIFTGMLIASVAACGTATKKDETAPVDDTAADTRQGAQDTGTFQSDPFSDPNNSLSVRTVYFEFVSSEVKPADREVIIAHAQYLAGNANAKVVLEGHADERGTREYNIALGERRAKAVAQLMLLQGVAQSQIDVISFGEERPVALGHDESAWAANRRVEIVYPGR